MLKTLSIQNVVIIEKLVIEFEQGLCTLTGETGAGKSILLDSLGLALGSRAESALVRKGADKAQVSAVFDVPADHESQDILREADVETGGELIVRRVLSADGRSKAYINDQPVSARLLRDVGETLVEIHGQFDTQGLLSPVMHRLMLDGYAGVGDELPSFWSTWKQAEIELKKVQEDAEQARQQEEYLRQSVEDLDALAPEAGEEEKLSKLREQLMGREQVLEALNTAYHALNAESDPVRTAWAALDRVADKLGESGREVIAALQRATNEVEDAVQAIQSVSSDLEHSEHSLESIDDRLHELRAQARKHSCAVDELAGVREELAGKLNMIEHTDDMLMARTKEVETARQAFEAQAQKISALRKAAAAKLDGLVATELAPLKLGKAEFVTAVQDLEESEWGPQGMDKVQFLVATNPGSAPGPLNKIASGGEMSRFMLALKVVLAEVGSAESLVFDEVDAGIGGGTADAVGERLARLSDSKQVLVVTHSPQVAARGKHHYIVRKDGADSVQTNVVQLESEEQRREEIARMLAGATITEEARAAADKLLESAA